MSENKKFVHHTLEESPISLIKAFSCAFAGVKHAVLTQRNFKIHLTVALVAIILSFECDGAILQDGAEICVLGDIVICPEVCRNQCTDFGNTFEEELHLLTCHGVLHLLGYDHIEDADAEVMEAKEKEILHAWEIRK